MTPPPDSADDLDFRRVLGHFASGLTIITGVSDGRRFGLTCQAFSSVSLDPPLVAFYVIKASLSSDALRDAGMFCVNILARDQQDVARIFAVSGADKFKDVATSDSPAGLPIINGSIAWIDCAVESVFDAGDHDGVIGAVNALGHLSNAKPLLFFRGGYGTFES